MNVWICLYRKTVHTPSSSLQKQVLDINNSKYKFYSLSDLGKRTLGNSKHTLVKGANK